MKAIEKIWEVGGKSLEWTEDNPVFEVETHVLYSDGSRWQYKGFINDAVNELSKQTAIGFAEWIAKEYWSREGAISATDTLGKWFNVDTYNKEWHNLDLTTEQLYELYTSNLQTQ